MADFKTVGSRRIYSSAEEAWPPAARAVEAVTGHAAWLKVTLVDKAAMERSAPVAMRTVSHQYVR